MKKYSILPDSPTHLTEFAPLSTEVSGSGGSSFSWARLFKWGNKSAQFSSVDSTVPNSVANSVELPDQVQKEEAADFSDSSSNGFCPDKNKSESTTSSEDNKCMSTKDKEIYTRSFTNVLRRISSILDKRLAAPNSYKDSDFKQYWMPDSDCKECYDCGDKFTTFRRRHHCRVCGQIFCSRCCNQEIPGKLIGYTGDLRVCTYCCKVVLACLQATDSIADSSDLHSLQEDLQSRLSFLDRQNDSSLYDGSGRSRRKNSVGFREQGYTRSRTTSLNDSSSIYSGSRDFLSPEQSSSEWKLLFQDSTQLKELWLQIQDPINGIQFHNHRQRLTTYPNCVVGSELVEWLIAADKACSRHQAVAICQALIDSKFLEPVASQEKIFLDEYALYRAGKVGRMETCRARSNKDDPQEHQEAQEPTWVKEIKLDSCDARCETDEFEDLESSHKTLRRMSSSRSMFYVTLDPEENTASLNKNELVWSTSSTTSPVGKDIETSTMMGHMTQNAQSINSRTSISEDFLKGAFEGNAARHNPVEGWHDTEALRQDASERLAFERLNMAYERHEKSLFHQLLSSHGLSNSWIEIIQPIIQSITKTIKPVKYEDEMDIRHYVQFKKIPGGSKSECEIINGVVCTKNVAHKKMKSYCLDPTILLISSPIVYQRQENKLLSLEPALSQEYNCLKNAVAKIATFKPSIVMVEKTVSRLAQDFLLDLDITLVLNVKQSVLERIARLTEADIVSSIDAQLSNPPKLGTCRHFQILNYAVPDGSSKTLMKFDGCCPELGCTVILRGASNAELSKVKRIAQFMIYMKYHQRLEFSFLMDEFAMPPPMPEEKMFVIGDSSDVSELGDTSAESLDEVNKSLNGIGNGMNTHSRTSVNGPCEADIVSVKSKEVPKSVTLKRDSTEIEKRCESRFLEDLSDPLRSYQQSEDDSIFECGSSSQLHVAKLPLASRFRQALDGTILGVSPSVKYSLPYLESKFGRNCRLRKFLPEEIYWSQQFEEDRASLLKKGNLLMSVSKNNRGVDVAGDFALTSEKDILPIHPLLTIRITTSVNDPEIQACLANYRAEGNRFRQLSSQEFRERINMTIKDDNCKKTDYLSNVPTAGFQYQEIDVLDPFNHQRLPVLFYSFSFKSINPCVHPWIPIMVFYNANDISLGEFLEKYCFRSSYVCPNYQDCDRHMKEHVRRFVHDNGSIHIILHELEEKVNKRHFSNDISMWSWCRKCKEPTPVVQMSTNTWFLSFAKYLELRFHGNCYTRRGAVSCTHSLHQDHYQYFACRQMVTAFKSYGITNDQQYDAKYSPITLREVVLPPPTIQCTQPSLLQAVIIEEIKQLAVKGHGTYSSVLDRLCQMQEEWECKATIFEDMLQDMLKHLQIEKNIFKEKISEIQIKLTSPTVENAKIVNGIGGKDDNAGINEDAELQLLKISDCVVKLKRLIAESVASWNNRLVELIQQRKKDEKVTKQITLGNIKTISAQTGSEQSNCFDSVTAPFLESSNLLDTSESVARQKIGVSADNFENNENPGQNTFMEQKMPDAFVSPNSVESSSYLNVTSFHSCLPSLESRNVSTDHEAVVTASSVSPSLNRHLQASVHKVNSEPLALSNLSNLLAEPDATHYSIFKSHAEYPHNGQDAEIENLASDCSTQDAIRDPENASVAKIDKPEVHGHERSRSDGDGKILLDKAIKLPSVKHEDDRTEKKSAATMKSMISQFLSTSASIMIPVPFSTTEHHLLPHCERIPLIVYENEPSSIIAYALSSADYELSMQELKIAISSLQKDSRNSSPVLKRKPASRDSSSSFTSLENQSGVTENVQGLPRKISGVLSFFRTLERGSPLCSPKRTSSYSLGYEAVHYTANTTYKENIAAVDEDTDDRDLGTFSQEVDKDKTKQNNGKVISPHVEVQFADSTAKFYCRVFFADQFSKLRRLVLPKGEDSFIRSLARCNDWLAKGGKSGCTFCKTHDDRFILKQMTRLEVLSFLNFAPHYMQYVTRAYNEDKPTTLAKIVGAFRIVYRNIQSNVTSKMDLLVMENLFYGRNINQTFDLKGSIRNRLVNTTGKTGDDIVLLDENLLKMTCDHPLYVRPHSKTVLTLAITNDTHFLSQHLVMDYSLLVGVDEKEKELVIGIIDYIRTFTWDKKLETLVKSSVIMGGQGKLPTVVSPEIYRSRFCEAMDSYFLEVPDQWSNLGRGVDV